MASNNAASDTASTEWEELSALTRVEVYQAAGMLVAQLAVSPAEACACADTHTPTTRPPVEVAVEIITRRLRLADDVTAAGPRTRRRQGRLTAMTDQREHDIIASFLRVTDRLVTDFDLLDLTTQLTQDCAALLDVDAAGLFLGDPGGMLHLLATTSHQAQTLEAFQLQREEGPAWTAFAPVNPSASPTWQLTRRRRSGPGSPPPPAKVSHRYTSSPSA